jgi:hypothetical protein
MTVRYIRVNPVADLFAPAVRAFGNIAVVGQVRPGAAAPAAPTVAAAAGTGLGVGTYRYTVTLVTAQGETETGAEATVATTAGNQAVNVTAIPTGTGAVARRLYRTAVNGAAGSGRLLATIEDNTTTTFTDMAPDARLGDEPAIARANTPIAFTDPAEARRRAPGDLGEAIALAFAQSPGPTLVYGVRTAAGPDWASAINAVTPLDAQLVVLANTALDATTGAAPRGAIALLADHVSSVSSTGVDGKERMGVAMLAKGATATGVVTGTLAHERMVYVAHKSDQDAAAALAGTIAGYEPHVSMLLKPVNITSADFTPVEIAALNGTETFTSGPAGKGVNWLVDPVLIPGRGTRLGEGYTGDPGGKRYIDVVRTVDDVSFRLKAQLIKTVGTLRVSRSGLRALEAQMEAVLQPLVQREVIEGFAITTPLKVLLDKDPNTLTEAELNQVNDAQNQRVVEVLASVDYAGAIHRLSITLKFV